MALGVKVWDGEENTFNNPRIVAEVIPVARISWFVEIHVHFKGETIPYHYQDLDKKFFLFRNAVRYGVDTADKLEWFFHFMQKDHPDWNHNDFARIKNLREIMDNLFNKETIEPIFIPKRE